MQKITPFLWLDGRLEEAVRFYASLFPNAKIGHIAHRNGEAFSATFELEGQTFMALSGRQSAGFSDAFSVFVRCETQAEVDRLWSALVADGGAESRCGWLKDRFGMSWQIIPDALMRYMSDPDPQKAQRVVAAMMKMRKIDIAALDAAYAG